MDVVEAGTIEEAIELTYERGWTDGLPVVPPTPKLVQATLDYLGRDPREVVGILPPKNGIATVEKIAINCVMAGCRPAYTPVVVSALKAMLAENFNLNGVQATTHCVCPLAIVTGPIVKELRFNSRENLFAGGNRANVTVGRALRLILWNIGGGAGELDKAVMGHPGKLAYCIAEEYREWNPWPPLHVERGFGPEESCVTMIGVEAPHHIITGGGYSPPDYILNVLADSMATLGNSTMNAGGDCLLVIGPLVANHLAKSGYSKERVREALMERARKPVRLMKYNQYLGDTHPFHFSRLVSLEEGEALVPLVRRPENLLIMVAGGWGSGTGICAFCPGWGQHGGWAQTTRVERPGV